MAVSMMDIWEVGMGMCQRLVPMAVTVVTRRIDRDVMDMLVVLIVNMRMFVLHHFMSVFVYVALGQVQPDSQCH